MSQHPRYFLVLRFVFSDRTETRYYVGKEEGYSVMESLAYKFEDHELGVLLHLIHEFYKNTERYLADAPSNCRSVTAYPVKVHEDHHTE